MSIKKTSYPFKFLGFALSFMGPADADDIERIVGEKRAVINGYMQQYCFHDRGPAAKVLFARKLEEYLGPDGDKQQFKMVTPEKGPNAGVEQKVYTESEKKFYDRVVANNGIPAAEAERIAREVNDELDEWKYDPSTSRKPGAEFYKLAENALARINDPANGAQNLALFTKNVESKLHCVFADTFGDPTLDNLARAYKALSDRKAEEAKAEARALFGEDDSSSASEGEEEEQS